MCYRRAPHPFDPPISNALPLWGRVAGSVAQGSGTWQGFCLIATSPLVPVMVMITLRVLSAPGHCGPADIINSLRLVPLFPL